MLVLSRKQHEELRIGSQIVIRVARVTGSRVWLAIDAPREVQIRRGSQPASEVSQDGPAADPDLESDRPRAALPSSLPEQSNSILGQETRRRLLEAGGAQAVHRTQRPIPLQTASIAAQ